MVAKKIKNPKKSAGKAARVKGLVGYILNPANLEGREKCVHSGARNFITEKPGSLAREMLALAQEGARSADPISHYVLSWQAGEKPTAEQTEKTVDLFMETLGIQDLQVVYGLHSDTDNYHLHLAVNRVHPDTFACARINGGFDIKAIHMAAARIEAAMGWKPEKNSLYTADADGRVTERPREAPGKRKPGQWKIDKELRTGEKSAERTAIEEAGPVIAAAGSWLGLHAALAEIGMRYAKKGSGAVVFVGETAVKASSVAREASLGRLEKRLGPYQESPPKHKADSLGAEERDGSRGAGDAKAGDRPGGDGRAKSGDRPGSGSRTGGGGGEREKEPAGKKGKEGKEGGMPKEGILRAVRRSYSWEAFHSALGTMGLRYVKKGSGAVFMDGEGAMEKASSVAREASLKSLEKKFGAYREPELKFKPKGRKVKPADDEDADGWEEYLAEREAYLAAKAKAKAEMDMLQDEELRMLLRWQRLRREEALAGSWKARGDALNAMRSVLAAEQASQKLDLKDRHRRERERFKEEYGAFPSYKQYKEASKASAMHYFQAADPAPADIRGYVHEIKLDCVYYSKKETPSDVAFIDKGKVVNIFDDKDPNTLLAILQLKDQEMPGKKFWVFGNREFKMLMAKVAVENGFEKMIANWGLKNVIKEMKNEKEEREKRQKEAGRQDEKPMPQTKKDGSESSQKQDAEKMKEEQKPPDPPHRGPKMRI